MNRKERRATEKQSLSGARRPGAGGPEAAVRLFERAVAHFKSGELAPAAVLFKKVLALRPDHAPACDQLALVLAAQGRLADASEQYAELARMVPQTLRDFDKVLATIIRMNPALESALRDPSTATLELLSTAAPSAVPRTTSIAGDAYFRTVLASTVVRNVPLERWLTALRAAILRAALADTPVGDDVLGFCAALAQQCFINEYVFAVAADEAGQVEQLKALVVDALAQQSPLAPLRPMALGMYTALHTFPQAETLLERPLPAALDAVVTQQVREPLEERRLRATIPLLTPLGDGITAEVRKQYEENPYPRWVRIGGPPVPLRGLDDYIRKLFPTTPYRPVNPGDTLDILVAGCGTGRHALEAAQGYRGARVLGVDLSLSSLAHAKRKTPAALFSAVEFAQADIRKIGSIGRSFDLITATGVLHHMDDPLGGWRELIKLMKPNGLMQVGHYSALARREILAARKLIAERGYGSTIEDIRRCRQDLLAGPEQFKFMGLADFFSASECRDLIFHVLEKQFTIPEIKAFLAENDMKFIGFEFGPGAHAYHRDVFARAGWSTSNLDCWDEYERANPDIFASMYIFWIQKN